MIPFETLFQFTVTVLMLAALPGPDSLFVLSQSALRGPRVGFTLTLGLCTGLMLYTIAVALGLAAVFQSSPLARALLKSLGVTYLGYLAYSSYRSPSDLATRETAEAGYWRGLLMNLSNPKVALFCLALLPQYTTPGCGNVTLQLLTLGGLMVASTFLVFSLFSLLAGCLSTRFRSSKGKLNRVTALIFFLLAVRLATT
jgi:threonine/homoserine/homoserine lactone efflux protein